MKKLISQKISQTLNRNYKYLFHREKKIDDFSLFINTIPKSGTHLLYNLFKGSNNFRVFDEQIRGGNSFGTYNKNYVESLIDSIINKELVKGHLLFEDHYKQQLIKKKCLMILLVRDPRDIMTSALNFTSNIIPIHILGRALKDYSYEDKIRLFIDGFEDKNLNFKRPPFSDLISGYYEWVEKTDFAIPVKFEDLKNDQFKIDFVKRIFKKLNLDFKDSDYERMISSSDPSRSFTFTKLSSKTWQSKIPVNLHDEVNLKLEPIIKKMGYEI